MVGGWRFRKASATRSRARASGPAPVPGFAFALDRSAPSAARRGRLAKFWLPASLSTSRPCSRRNCRGWIGEGIRIHVDARSSGSAARSCGPQAAQRRKAWTEQAAVHGGHSTGRGNPAGRELYAARVSRAPAEHHARCSVARRGGRLRRRCSRSLPGRGANLGGVLGDCSAGSRPVLGDHGSTRSPGASPTATSSSRPQPGQGVAAPLGLTCRYVEAAALDPPRPGLRHEPLAHPPDDRDIAARSRRRRLADRIGFFEPPASPVSAPTMIRWGCSCSPPAGYPLRRAIIVAGEPWPSRPWRRGWRGEIQRSGVPAARFSCSARHLA